MDHKWWRRFPDSPTGGPTLTRELNLATVLLAALRHYHLTKPHLPVKIAAVATTDPALTIVPRSWLCHIIEEHLKSEYTLSSDGHDVYPKDLPRGVPRPTSPSPLRWKRSRDDPDTPPPLKRRVTLRRKFLLQPRKLDKDDD